MSIRFSALLVVLVLFFVSCTGGGGVETGNYLTMTIRDSHGKPAIGAHVARFSMKGYEERIKQASVNPISIDTTDSLGRIVIEMTDDSSTMLLSQYDNEIGWINESGKATTLNLTPAINITGKFTSTKFPQKIFIPGTYLQAQVNSNGQFSLVIPQYKDQHAILLAGVDSNRIRTAGYWNSKLDSFVAEWEPNRFMIARFDAETGIVEPQWIQSGSARNGGAIWLKEYPPSKFLPSGVTDSLELGIAPPDSSYRGRSMHLIFAPDTVAQPRYLWVRFVFGKGDEGFDFSCLDSLVFRYKGTAATSLLARDSSGNALSISIPTQSDWTRISIPVTSLHGSSPSWSWDGFKTHISSIIFSSEQAGDFWLDDFEAIGCSLGEVYPSLGL